MAGARIRPATVEDADTIARVHVETWKVAYRGIVADEILDGLSIPERAERWRSFWTDDEAEHRETFVAEAGTVVGFVNIGSCRDEDASPRTGEVRAIYVLSEYWDKGVGAALMQTAIEALRARFDVVTLWVLEDNARGRRFYERGGWRADGARQPLEHLGGLIEVR